MDFKETLYRDIGLEQPTDWFPLDMPDGKL